MEANTDHGVLDVTFSASLIGRQVRAAGDPGIFLLVRLDGQPRGSKPDGSAVEHVQAAVRFANDTVPPKSIVGGFVTATVRGVAVHTILDSNARGVTAVWLQALATSLEGLGRSGRISTSGTWEPETEHFDGFSAYPAAFVGYRMDGYRPRLEPFNGWQVDAPTTRRVTDRLQRWLETIPAAQTWAYMPHGRVPIAAAQISDFLAATVSLASGLVGAWTVTEDGSAFYQANLSGIGQCVTQSVVLEADWRTLLEAQTRCLLVDPTSVDVGMVKNIPRDAFGWSKTDYWDHHAPVRNPIDYMANRHLWDEFVIDAAGISLLTSKHLQHAHDLSEWTIEEVAPDRHLVSTREPASWYAGLAASEEVLAKARRDFGDMILSWDTIVARPGPYSSHNPAIVGR